VNLSCNKLSAAAVSEDDHISFSTILASSIHDMKNSLGIVLNSVDELVHSAGDSLPAPQLVKLQCEAQRVSDNLVQLLALYKMEKQGLALNIDEYCVGEFLGEVAAAEQVMVGARDLRLELHCDDNLTWYFDRDLIAGVLKNAVNNAARYARSKVLITAVSSDDSLILSVNDDGDGFSQEFLAAGRKHGHGVDFSSGNTGLGLYFTAKVAELHNNRDRRGFIELSNGHGLGGACFSIVLP